MLRVELAQVQDVARASIGLLVDLGIELAAARTTLSREILQAELFNALDAA